LSLDNLNLGFKILVRILEIHWKITKVRKRLSLRGVKKKMKIKMLRKEKWANRGKWQTSLMKY